MTLTTIVNANDLFDNLRREEEQEIRELNVGKSKAKEIMDLFNRLYERKTSMKECRKIINPQNARDITAFSIILKDAIDSGVKYSEDFAGSFINELIKKCIELEVIIYSSFLGHSYHRSLANLGRLNEVYTITIRGNARDIGSYMKGGKIISEGKIYGEVGRWMTAGVIELNGDFHGNLGQDLNGGEIHLNGSLLGTGSIGPGMRKGRIYVEGEIPRLPRFAEGGEIYHKGKLVFKDGKDLR